MPDLLGPILAAENVVPLLLRLLGAAILLYIAIALTRTIRAMATGSDDEC
jgi:threonine/homoserine/homoserine lactone efflux protein